MFPSPHRGELQQEAPKFVQYIAEFPSPHRGELQPQDFVCHLMLHTISCAMHQAALRKTGRRW